MEEDRPRKKAAKVTRKDKSHGLKRSTTTKPERIARKPSAFQKQIPVKAAKTVSFKRESIFSNALQLSASTAYGSPKDGNASSTTRGLRQMSIKICEKVKRCGRTTCSEVAEELLQVIRKEHVEAGDSKVCDEKNIRRRLYDALNVLEAVNVVTKDSKDITWKGMPTDHQHEYRRLKAERDVRKKRMKDKEEALREQLMQQVSYSNLVRYNERRDQAHHVRLGDKIPLPFVIFNAHPYAEVHCDASCDLSHVMLNVNAPFALHDDNSILRQMGLNQTTIADLQLMLPEDMLNYCQKQSVLRGILSRKRGLHNVIVAVQGVAMSDRRDWAQPPKPKRMKMSMPRKGGGGYYRYRY